MILIRNTRENVGAANATRSVRRAIASSPCQIARTSVDLSANCAAAVSHWATPPKLAEVSCSSG